MKRKRPTRPSWYMKLAIDAADMSEDPWVQVGAVAVRPNGSIAAVCYNGAPPKVELDWSNRDERRKFVCHSEQNLTHFIRPNECDTVAVTLAPCLDCMKSLASYGIKTVYFRDFYDKCSIQDLNKAAKLFKMKLIQIIS